MKLGYFSYSNLRVSETFIYDLVKDLSQHEQVDLTYYSGMSTGEIVSDFKLNYVLTGYAEIGEKLSFRAFKLGQIFGKGYQYKSAVQRWFAFRALKKRVRDLPDVAYIDYADSGVLVREFLEYKKIPYILHVHGFDITSSLNDTVFARQLTKVFSGATYILVASDYMRRLLLLLEVKAEKIKVIRYGIDVKAITPMKWEERMLHPPSVIFLGRLTDKKHPIALLHAFKLVLEKFPTARLTIIGDGVLKKVVEDRVVLLNLTKSVDLLGSLPREKAFPIINRHWVFAQHSVTSRSGDQEGYALSPAEAAAHELPVVSTIHNGIPEHVIDGTTGFLVPEFNFEAMAEKIVLLLQNPKLAEKMGKAGRINIASINIQEKRVSEIADLLKITARQATDKE
jgi:colanic acid/amylovoran biosynthesis glycosyltransferase